MNHCADISIFHFPNIKEHIREYVYKNLSNENQMNMYFPIEIS